MTKRIFRSILAVVIVVLLFSIAFMSSLFLRSLGNLQHEQLHAQMDLASVGYVKGGMNYLKALSPNTYRLTLIAPDGKVLYDTDISAYYMGNHFNRPEVSEARKDGVGESYRYSETMLERTVYLAEKLPDGKILRLSLTEETIVQKFFDALPLLIALVILSIILSSLLESRLSKRIVRPLNNFNLDEPMENESYDELAPMLNRIEKLHRQIDAQIQELNRKTHEFDVVTASMNEGLVLFGMDHKILTMNEAAKKIFNVGNEAIGQGYLLLNRSRKMTQLMEETMANGKSEVRIPVDGKAFQLNGSRIDTEAGISGVVLFAFDVTDKVFAERNRREFTANVSHELKTPLQSILGGAELIKTGLVKEEDLGKFVDRIHRDASRLLSMINDMIRLSQLDEAESMSWGSFDLNGVVNQVRDVVLPLAARKDIELTIESQSIELYSVRQLFYDIIANLCENAIKYTLEGGKVSLKVNEVGDLVILEVSDTGIGIPAEDRERIFERFYRVDKSHSRAVQGTGLGLSIVKHAVQYLHGQIILVSEVDVGTTITVTLPKKRD